MGQNFEEILIHFWKGKDKHRLFSRHFWLEIDVKALEGIYKMTIH